MINAKPTNHLNQKRFDAFMDLKPVNPWSQTLCIMNEAISVEQTDTGAVFVKYSGSAQEILALMVALCGIYRGHPDSTPGRWYFHAQLEPCLRIAILALQDKAPCQLVEDILSARA